MNVTRILINKTRLFLHEDQIKIFILYLVMLSGGIIQYFQIHRSEMEALSTFVIAGISLSIFLEYYWHAKKKLKDKTERKKQVTIFTIWLGIVFVLSLIIENIGVLTGVVFGAYTYGAVLTPSIGNVPLAIGFAWINMLVPAMMISRRFIKRYSRANIWLSSGIIGLLMVLFDLVLEKAAMELNYWHWENNLVPWQNYLAWFVIGFIFARIGFYLKIERYGIPQIYQHIYLAQLGYFILIVIR